MNIVQLINDCKRLDESALKISELKSYDQEEKIHEVAQQIKKSRAADMAKSRAKADFLRDVRLTKKASCLSFMLIKKLYLNLSVTIASAMHKMVMTFFKMRKNPVSGS